MTTSTTCMKVIAETADAVYLRLPAELQRDTDGCDCQHCKRNPALAKWDTLVVPKGSPNDHSYTIHMPDGSIQAFKAYIAAKKGRGDRRE